MKVMYKHRVGRAMGTRFLHCDSTSSRRTGSPMSSDALAQFVIHLRFQSTAEETEKNTLPDKPPVRSKGGSELGSYCAGTNCHVLPDGDAPEEQRQRSSVSAA